MKISIYRYLTVSILVIMSIFFISGTSFSYNFSFDVESVDYYKLDGTQIWHDSFDNAVLDSQYVPAIEGTYSLHDGVLTLLGYEGTGLFLPGGNNDVIQGTKMGAVFTTMPGPGQVCEVAMGRSRDDRVIAAMVNLGGFAGLVYSDVNGDATYDELYSIVQISFADLDVLYGNGDGEIDDLGPIALGVAIGNGGYAVGYYRINYGIEGDTDWIPFSNDTSLLKCFDFVSGPTTGFAAVAAGYYSEGSYSVPEPTTALLIGLGLVGLFGSIRKYKI